MNLRRLAVSAAAVAVMAGGGLAVTASPAAAMDDDCRIFQRISDRAARHMDEWLGVDYFMWETWYDVWLGVEELREDYGC